MNLNNSITFLDLYYIIIITMYINVHTLHTNTTILSLLSLTWDTSRYHGASQITL